MSLSVIRIYTDGSCSPNPGPGGWGAVLLFADGEKVVELQGAEESATNNRMELLAALQALQTLETGSSVEVYTDSKYLQRGIFEWLKKWQENGWRTAEGEEVKNRDLWKPLALQLRRHKISWIWIKGHAGDKWNERADLLAVEARGSLKTIAEPVDPRGVHFYPAVTWKNGSGAGGWAVILNYQTHYKVLGGYEQNTTANRLYLLAVIRGLQHLKRSLPVYIHTRSGYLRDGLETWLDGWRRRNWHTKDGGEVSNVQEWQHLADFKRKFHLRVITESAEEQRCHNLEAKEIAREFGELLDLKEPC